MSDDDYPLVPDGFEARAPLERAGIEGHADDADEDPVGVGFPGGDAPPSVWLAQPAEDLRRGHHVVVLARGGSLQAYEIDGWKEEKPIARLLSLAGHAPAKPLGTAPRLVNVDEQMLVPVMGFSVPQGKLGAVTLKLAQAMRGELGGFSALGLGQLGFHQAHTAFQAAWEAAGKPPMQVRRPQWVDPGASSGVPLPLAQALEAHVGHGASLGYWEGRPLFEDEPEGEGGTR
jgi:hypothetical protein